MDEAGFLDLARGSVLTVGTFDGVHLGHREILNDLDAVSKRTGLPAALVTFAPHPLAVVNPSAAPRLLTLRVEPRWSCRRRCVRRAAGVPTVSRPTTRRPAIQKG